MIYSKLDWILIKISTVSNRKLRSILKEQTRKRRDIRIWQKLKRKGYARGFESVLAHINRANVHRERTNSPTRGESRRKSLYLITFFRLFLYFAPTLLDYADDVFLRASFAPFFLLRCCFFLVLILYRGVRNGGNHPFGKTSDFIYNREAERKRKREIWR